MQYSPVRHCTPTFHHSSLTVIVMFYPSILLAFAAAAAAIDVRMRRDSTSCGWGGGGWVACNGINPNTCCATSEGLQTIWIAAIPNGWNIGANVWFDTGCSNRSPLLQGGGRSGSDVCERAGGNNMRAGSYSFLSKKREADVSTGCQQADTFVLADGTTQYNITGLLPAAINELVSTVLQYILRLKKPTNTS